MSKLIDAEKLDLVSYQGIPNGYKDSFDNGVLYAMNLIDKQPTIDAVPVVHGHWRRGKSYPHNIYCSNCYRTYVPNDEIEMWKDDTRLPRKYCPECGAKMDEVTI